MLTSSKTTDIGIWPSLKSRKDAPLFANDDFFPLKSTNRFQAVSTGKTQNTLTEHSDDDSVYFNIENIESTCAPPEFTQSFGIAIAEALNSAAQLKNPRKQQTSSSNGRAAGSKKKRNNKMILFSTGGYTFDGK